MGLALSDVENGDSKDAIGPCEPTTSVLCNIVDIDALVNKAFEGGVEDHVDAFHNLRVIIGRLRLDKQAHGPGILQADMGACMGLVRAYGSQKAFPVANLTSNSTEMSTSQVVRVTPLA